MPNSIYTIVFDFYYSAPWAATGSMDQKLIIWDLQHSLARCTCEHEVRLQLNSTFNTIIIITKFYRLKN